MYSSIIYVSVRIDDREEQGRMTVVRVVCCLGRGDLEYVHVSIRYTS